ncbi:YdeI/OmpD-associated family protein [Bdellovibrio sp. HCB209]|uniref:YdeI/OmpD-associated family protein n=1 Tax=Bdellovibrio sp. HCB209 TaxID=3394354 RepID=UPI0039B5DDA5
MSKPNAKVDTFIKSSKKWKTEAVFFRKLAIECGLDEELKWNLPTYTLNGNNIVMFQAFKDYGAIMFFKGVLIKDPKKLLKAPGENSNIVRRYEFDEETDLTKAKTALKGFIKQAIKLESEGAKIEKTKPAPITGFPIEFKAALSKNKKLKAAFDKLTPGRQRLYVIHISSAKQSATRLSRIEKCIPKILKGLGLNE